MKPTNIKTLQEKSRDLSVRRITANTLSVSSASRQNRNGSHTVSINMDDQGILHAHCDCDWARNGGMACSHVIAALRYVANTQKRKISFWNDADEANRQRRKVLRLRGNNEDVYITTRSELSAR